MMDMQMASEKPCSREEHAHAEYSESMPPDVR
jgi:hypothetical protein